jgi:hypothetical protein
VVKTLQDFGAMDYSVRPGGYAVSRALRGRRSR